MLSTLPTPALIAHRGYSILAPENTIAAFDLAIHHNADGIELDAKLSNDDKVVIIHDQTVDRTTNYHGRVKSFTLKELQAMDAGSHFDPIFEGEKIPSLDEVLNKLGAKTFINIELTNYSDPFDDLPLIVARLLSTKGLTHNILISSFNPIALYKFHQILPDVSIGFLISKGKKGFLARIISNLLVPYDTLNIEFNDVSQEFVNKLHSKNKKIFAYTVNNADDIKKMDIINVDGIITDDPPFARRILQDN
jgi:glycerophosphoryl diester phosphodiesterase